MLLADFTPRLLEKQPEMVPPPLPAGDSATDPLAGLGFGSGNALVSVVALTIGD
jgi:hypothetical protein